MAEPPTCLNCPKQYWIAFVLESRGGESSDGYEQDGRMPAGIGPEWHSFFPASGSARDGHRLALLRNVVWLDEQGAPVNDIMLTYYCCPDIEAIVAMLAEPVYEQVLP